MGSFIAEPQKNKGKEEEGEEDEVPVASTSRFKELAFVEKFHYEDALALQPVPHQQVADLNAVNGVEETLTHFLELVRPQSLSCPARAHSPSSSLTFPL